MHIITDDHVHRLITMSDAISTLRRALAEQGSERAKVQPRVRTLGEKVSLSTMGAILPGAGVCGAKVYSTYQGKFDFVIPLFSTHDGRLLSIIHGNALTEYRTAAITRIALDRFGCADAKVLTVFGTGIQAKAHIRAIVENSGIERVLIVGIEGVPEAVAQMQALFPNVRFEASTAEAAVKTADVIVTATRSAAPLFDGAHVKPNTFVAAIGSSKPSAREIDDRTLARAGLVIVESLEQAKAEAGDLLMASPGIVDWNNVIELGDAIANGDIHSRVQGDLTVFKSIGIGLADVALGELVTRRVIEEAGQ
ncbi:MAG TPA: ornithine cyclodeaminase family protein [Trinickia sp.]|jgi:ornithine cyclodeaminase/alanine dehydrogenase-like protein (mu-crystallin family)|uniref:ornithine cyclodeaminase family protein n=1 Tax=Trinickia sp. TaxID=2571163 RepID=UPI002B86DAF6|nr:ornithine cyclodeaminase family protein [Trinickia sp.]HTI16975.1 ornithine cyclodeaminase family protein [Trinickia sp.]